jgi:hypothetical protein
MKEREQLSKSELHAHLQEQLQFLEASCNSFDAGFEGEAKRLAVTIRVLVHDTQQSKSLLGQLDLKGEFFDSAAPFNSHNFATFSGLTNTILGRASVRHVAPLDSRVRTH